MYITEELSKKIKTFFPDYHDVDISTTLSFLRKRFNIYMKLTEKRDFKNRVVYGFVLFDKFFNVTFQSEEKYDTVFEAQSAMIEKILSDYKSDNIEKKNDEQKELIKTANSICDMLDALLVEENTIEDITQCFFDSNSDIIEKMTEEQKELIKIAIEYGWTKRK